MHRAYSLEKSLMLEKIKDKRRRRGTENEMVGWHHWLNGHKFEPTLGNSEGQWSLACCSPWRWKESDKTEQLNNHHHVSGLLALWGGPHSSYEVCFSFGCFYFPRRPHALGLLLPFETFFLWNVYLSKYLSLCLSLNSFCNETSSTWSSLSVSSKKQWVQVPTWVLAEFKSQFGFWLGSSPDLWVQVSSELCSCMYISYFYAYYIKVVTWQSSIILLIQVLSWKRPN